MKLVPLTIKLKLNVLNFDVVNFAKYLNHTEKIVDSLIPFLEKRNGINEIKIC